MMEKQLPDRLVFNVAMLAHSALPRYAAFDADPALAHVDQVDKSLVLPLVKHKKVGPEFWHNLSEEFKVSDSRSAEVRIDLLKGLSEKYAGVEPIELEESVAYVARNLVLKGETPNAASVKKEVASILERRKAIEHEDLFNRDVVLISGDELWQRPLHPPDASDNSVTSTLDSPRFGPQALQDQIRARQQASGHPHATLNHVTPLSQDSLGYHSTPESIANAKFNALVAVATPSGKPLTVFFDGHGSPEYFALSASLGTPDEAISVEELADALTQRYQSESAQHHSTKELQVSFIFDDCEMQGYVRKLSEVLAQRNVPSPHIMITTSEYDQYGFSNPVNPFGSNFNVLMMNSLNLKAVMEHKHDIQESDPSIFVPRKEDHAKIMQVSGIVLANFPSIG